MLILVHFTLGLRLVLFESLFSLLFRSFSVLTSLGKPLDSLVVVYGISLGKTRFGVCGNYKESG